MGEDSLVRRSFIFLSPIREESAGFAGLLYVTFFYATLHIQVEFFEQVVYLVAQVKTLLPQIIGQLNSIKLRN